ncbi:MAG: hypothetical protein ACKOEE_01615, partial [Tagaea sp.]
MESPADRLAEPPAWALDAPARKLLDALGPEARFVGGCVRDALIGAAPADLDLGVPYPPEETVARLKRAKLRAIPVGIAHEPGRGPERVEQLARGRVLRPGGRFGQTISGRLHNGAESNLPRRRGPSDRRARKRRGWPHAWRARR